MSGDEPHFGYMPLDSSAEPARRTITGLYVVRGV